MTNVPVSVIIATRNEEANIPKCLDSLAPANEVIIVDSKSQDETLRIVSNYQCEVLQFKYEGGYPKKRQWVLDSYSFKNEWVLLIDADEVVSPELWQSITRAINSNDHVAYLIQKQFHFLGKAFKFGGFSHEAVVLLRRGCARFEETMAEIASGLDMEVHERLIVDGSVGYIQTPLIHEDFKGLKAYIERHNAYSTWESQLRYDFLYGDGYQGAAIKPKLFGDSQARRRFIKHLIIRIPFEANLWFVYHYVLRAGFLEGRAGYIAARMRANYIQDVRDKTFEIKWNLEHGAD